MSGISLAGRVAVVTGAGRGLGRAYAEALAAAGAAVVVNDVDEGAIEEVAGSIRERGGHACAVVAPVGPTSTAELLVTTARREFERIDAMVANAGVLRDRVLWKMSDEDFDTVVDVHLRGAFTCGRAAAAAMREQGEGGRIVLVGSPAGQFGSFGQTNYASAKAGIVAMARTWSLELAKSAITVNAVVPTAMTEMTGTIPIYADLYQRFIAGEPVPPAVRREHALGGPEDAAPLIVWLVSDQAADVTGQAIGIGGDRLTLYAHPSELEVAYRDGGWTADSIAEAWERQLGSSAQTSGPEMRPLGD
jgi:3-oxoacyl-[acyl-carrier protein] reductase